ncbi:MAG: ATP-binding protein [Acutalibacteraceae bacterium]
MNCLKVDATVEKWSEVYKFLNKCLLNINIEKKIAGQILVASEEIFVNISHYAYKPSSKGKVEINFNFKEILAEVSIKFIDNGVFFDPTKVSSVHINEPAIRRPIGGLGLFIVKKVMDKMVYEHKNNQNNLIIIKKIK